MTKIQTMHSRVLQDSLRHTLESNWHLWNPMGDMGPFFAILNLKYNWPTGLFRNPTLTTWGSYWTLSGPGPFIFVYLSCLGIFVDRNLPWVIWDVLGVAQHSHHRVVHLAKSQKLLQDHKRSPKILSKTVQSHQRGSPQEVIFLHKVAFFFSPSLVNFNFTKLCLLC